jgi:tetratricopeptide (TPR) repeat protein
MIERLLEADRLLAMGMDAHAERIYWQAAEMDPRNAIAIVGLARVASERGDDRTALQFAHKALEIDPENPAAIRLSARLAEIIRYREMAEAEAISSEPAAAARATQPEAETQPEAAIQPEPEAKRPEPAAPVPPRPPAPIIPPQVTLPPMPAATSPGLSAHGTPPKRGLLRRLMGGR